MARTKHIWNRTSASQRRGYFLAGVGLDTGEALDAAASVLNQLLVTANGAILSEDDDTAIAAITAFAEKAFTIEPFVPEDLPSNWRDILRLWLKGQPTATVSTDDEDNMLQFVEQALVYRLPWAMEAVRVRAIANSDSTQDGIMLEEVELGAAVAAVESGTLHRSAAVLMRAGFSSRSGAIVAVVRARGTFTNLGELREWLQREDVAAWGADPDWPTPASHGLWIQFLDSIAPAHRSIWTKRSAALEVRWESAAVDAGTPVRLHDYDNGTLVLDPAFTHLGYLTSPINPRRRGLVQAVVSADKEHIDVIYLGPNDLGGTP